MERKSLSYEQLEKNLSNSLLLIAGLEETVSRQKTALESLRKSDERYNIHFSLANDIMFSYDNLFRVLTVSPNVERILGYRPEEFIGKTFHEAGVLSPEYMSLAVSNALQVLSGKPVLSSVYEFTAKDGSRKFGEVSGVPLMHDGKVEAVITVARDITDRIAMDRSLRESEERYRITLEGLPDAVSILRAGDTVHLYANETFCRMTGYDYDEVVGKTLLELNLPAAQKDAGSMSSLMKDMNPIDGHAYQCRRKDGIILDTVVSARPVHYSGSDCMIVVMSDVTAVKRMEEEKKLLEIQSQKMESIGTLARGIAHDFNNILTTIIGYTRMSLKDIAALAKEEKDFGSIRSDLGEVQKSALRARDLVDQILAFSRHTAKMHAPIVLRTSIRESLKMLRPILPGTIEIREKLGSAGRIMGDPAQIHQVIMNLCTNAAHAMNDSSGVLEISLTEAQIDSFSAGLDLDLVPGPYLKLTVHDTGRGMTSRVMARIFDPYFTTKGRGQGTGLGLSVVHGIVKSHRGTICCKSAPEQGTTFDIYFPLIGEEEETAHPETGRGKAAKPASVVFMDEERAGSNPGNDKQGNAVTCTGNGRK